MGILKLRFSTYKRMWRRLQNIFYSLRTYADLSPDIRVRQRVNRFLRSRSPLSAEEWFEQFWSHRKIFRQVADFVYNRMPAYSGLEFSRVRPEDRLNEDLQFPLVCWFDWQFSLCEDFLQSFGVDLSDRFDLDTFSTIEDLVVYLNYQALSLNHSNGQ